MYSWILLLRGINVGGKNKIRMVELIEILQSFGFNEIKSYKQSGNIIFKSETIPSGFEDDIADAINAKKGFRPKVLIISSKSFSSAIKANPFDNATADPKKLHFYFLAEKPHTPDIEAINKLKKPSENYWLTDHVFYLHTPEGFGRSKLAASVEKHLGIPVTARNWQAIFNLQEILASD
ncbi:MAG: DUF1697 domain-containing protein [Candidatus Cyclobacteriaceae bacterium M2_1C_046]